MTKEEFVYEVLNLGIDIMMTNLKYEFENVKSPEEERNLIYKSIALHELYVASVNRFISLSDSEEVKKLDKLTSLIFAKFLKGLSTIDLREETEEYKELKIKFEKIWIEMKREKGKIMNGMINNSKLKVN